MKTSELIDVLTRSMAESGDMDITGHEALRISVPLRLEGKAPPREETPPPTSDPPAPLNPEAVAMGDLVDKQGHTEVRARFG